MERKTLFIEGYLTDRFIKGERPKYGYPNDGGLPKVQREPMKVQTCFKGGRKDDQ